MINIEDLPLTMTASDINKYLRKCRPETLRETLRQGKIKGKRLNEKRILYDTKSVLAWLGLAELEAASDDGEKPHRSVTRRKESAR